MVTTIPATYSEARAQFRALTTAVQARWPSARLETHPLAEYPELTVDWLRAAPLVTRQRLLIVTTGVHGIEGYVGAAVLQLLVDEILPRLDPRTTGVLFIHALNPWGMAHRQKTNAANVDLNRNFAGRADDDVTFNMDYDGLRALLDPPRQVRRRDLCGLRFLGALLGTLRRFSAARVQEAFLIGQYRHADGIFYGGAALQEELQLLQRLFRESGRNYEQALYLELHTGYGPRHQMSLVNSPQELRSDRELALQFDYPLVMRAEPGAFYAIRGDVVDGLVSLVHAEIPRMRFYGVTLEFGTLGDSLLNKIRSMQTMVLANQLRHHGAQAAAVSAAVTRRFDALYAPTGAIWLAKALADARRAFTGILRAENFLPDKDC